jgi:hypothetical protein
MLRFGGHHGPLRWDATLYRGRWFSERTIMTFSEGEEEAAAK